ncbi:HAMP domain-containing sensor histidine kinase [Solimonas terrae]|uniref:histidine kinase n=1 Tax=Solimonas terrae TaxID=1396819 RepID=A0A6M2BQQ1_9GAMM|nr:HAMP domain-containing sensor histidine kinase [Solimonas terrae]NGY04630.1 HAMP domain-containing histidine kinase [Solimonas terrae]
MAIRIPNTMTGLVAAGCVLAALPLLIALLLAELALERVTQQTERLIDQGVAVSQLGDQMRDQLQNLERTIRQYLALQDPALLSLSDRRWNDLHHLIREIEAHQLDPDSARRASAIRHELAEARLDWQLGTAEAESMQEAVSRIQAVEPQVDTIRDTARQRIDERLAHVRRASRNARRDMLLSALTLIPLAALLAYLCSVAVTRPLRDLYRTIAALGHGRYSHPVSISFPREMRRLGDQLDWLRRRLAQLEADKDQFLRQVSHELKTPLASLREGADLLHEGSLGPLSPRQHEVAGILAESTVELESLISNLLAYAEWRSERRHAQRRWFDARPMLEELLALHMLPMAKRELRTQFHLSPAGVFGQRSQLRLALDNLLTNAIKHAPPGSVIEIETATPDNHCEISVRDYGRGVMDEEKKRIFEPFIRGTEAEERGIRGTGVGLSIVREVAQAHGGHVEVCDARPGARFVLRWPCPLPQHVDAVGVQHDAELSLAV